MSESSTGSASPTADVSKVSRSILLAVLALLAGSNSTFAWQGDLHDHLTRFLALQAGACPATAMEISKADVGMDSAKNGAVRKMVYRVILGTPRMAEDASYEIRRDHFPAIVPPPRDPEDRPVLPESDFAEKRLLAQKDPAAVGEALHAFQDSWSHQGVPDIPLRIRERLAWAHPERRGGWRRHAADLTHKHVGEVLEVAERSYEILGRFLKESGNEDWRCGEPRPWAEIKPRVLAFAEAKTLPEKLNWLKEVSEPSPEDLELISELSLPMAGMTWEGLGLEEPGYGLRQEEIGPDVPQVVVDFAQDIMGRWFEGRDVEALLAATDLKEVSATDRRATPEELAEIFFALWLVGDHGLVERLGHGDPADEAFGQLLELVRDRERLSLTEVSYSVLRFPEQPGKEDRRFGLVVEFDRLPHDIAMLEITLSEETPRITDFLWVAL